MESEMREMAVFLGFVLAVSAPVEAFAASAQAEEVGVPDGRLAASALTSGDYGKAVKRLSLIAPDAANDPARLINLGNAYARSEEHTSELQSLMRISYAVFC